MTRQKRTGGIWQEIDKVADEVDDLRQDVWGTIDKLEAHLKALDGRLTDHLRAAETKAPSKKKPAKSKP